MNWVAHIAIAYFIIHFIIPDAQQYLLPIAIFSIILDIDHIPGLIKEMFMSKKEIKKIIKNPRLHSKLVRSDVEEPIGIITIVAILLALYALGVESIIIIIAVLSIVIHYLVDFLTVITAPGAPVSDKKKVCFFGINEKLKHKIQTRILLTVISVILFLIAYFYL